MTKRTTTTRPECLVMEGVSDDCYWCAWVWALCWSVSRWPHAVLIGAIVLLTGCAEVYDKPGASQADFDRDSWECETGIPASAPAMIYAPSASSNNWVTGQMQGQALANSSANWAAAARSQSLFRRCMSGRGWTRQ